MYINYFGHMVNGVRCPDKYWKFISQLRSDLLFAERKLVNIQTEFKAFKKKFYTDEYNRGPYGPKDYQMQLKNKDKRIESLELAQINVRSNNLKETDLLGEKIESLQDEIKHLKGLKLFDLETDGEYSRHRIEANRYCEWEGYTVFKIADKEIFKIKTDLITAMHIREY